jgi:hypothetical protein
MADSLLPLSRLRARLATPRGKDRVEALLAVADPAAAVAALPVSEVYQLVHEVGFGEALELIALATPEQFQGCLDIDLWDRDQMQLEAATPWLTALIEAGHERLAEVWERLDAELTALIVARSTHIYDLALGEEPDDSDGRPIVLTPDRYFAVKIMADDGEAVRLVHRLIEDLYRADPSGQLARHTLMAARSEPVPELEETSYRWRSGRMADMGYADFYEALAVFRPLDPASVKLGEGTEDRFGDAMETTESMDATDATDAMDAIDDDPLRPSALPLSLAERVVGKSFLARAMDRIAEREEIDRLEMALVVLVNKVLAAARVAPREREAVEIGAEHTMATLALGLEAVSQGDLDRAARALETISLTRLHRVGHTVALRLALFAHRLRPRVATAGPPMDALLAALCAPRPLFPRELDDPPGAGPRPFESMADVRAVAEALTALALRVAVAESVGADLTGEQPEPRPALPELPGLDDHVRTALVRAMMGHDVVARPLTLEDITRFAGQAMERGVLTAEARQAGTRALIARLDQAGVTAARQVLPKLLDGWFADIEDALGHLPPKPDPRFIDRVLIARE